ncbi:MAG: GMC family oxidoreductase [Deltaproteobacteria bacterium]|nr:GMC family oxidoreductase [Deltaproteobacteria bacterium]
MLDLEKADCPSAVTAGVCVIGSGAAGSYVAARLARMGHNVALLEAGGTDVIGCTEAGFEPISSGARYGGVYEGRGFGLGGTSALWGGALIPHDHTDIRPEDPTFEAWQVIVGAVNQNVSLVRKTLGLDTPTDFGTRASEILGPLKSRFESAGLSPIVSEMIPFRLRNLSRLLPGEGRVRVFLNSTVRSLTVASPQGSPRIVEATAVSRSGRALGVRAETFVIAAGAIESARVLLELDGATNGQVLKGRESIGVGLSDHLSVRGADVHKSSLKLASELFAPHFDGSVLRAVRLRDTTVGMSLPRHFMHVVFPIENAGFQLAKNVLGSLQKRSLPRVSIEEAASGFAGLTALAFGRYARQRLHVPADTASGLQLDIEQTPSRDNFVSLSSEVDAYGRPRAAVRWSIAESDLDYLRSLQTRILGKWASLGGLPALVPVPVGTISSKLHDSYHPVGTCRMGRGPESVVDFELRARGLGNLHVLSTGVLPTAGSANPTLTLLCLAEQLVTNLSGRKAPA